MLSEGKMERGLNWEFGINIQTTVHKTSNKDFLNNSTEGHQLVLGFQLF